jgi:hypothetical protein
VARHGYDFPAVCKRSQPRHCCVSAHHFLRQSSINDTNARTRFLASVCACSLLQGASWTLPQCRPASACTCSRKHVCPSWTTSSNCLTFRACWRSPGRHVLHSAHQHAYFNRVLNKPLRQLEYFADFASPPTAAKAPVAFGAEDHFTDVVYAVTSMNQSNSRWTCLP